MGRSIGLGLIGVVLVGLAGGACSGNSSKKDSPDDLCQAGSRRCDGLNIKVCNDDGSAETIEKTCLPSQSCADGECTGTACVPNTKFCKGGAIWKCDGTGDGSTLSQQCAAGLFCREDDEGGATCSTKACTPGEAVCNEDLATTCKADGSGPTPGGTDCAATKQSCYRGSCKDVACTNGMRVCQHDDVYLCSDNGTGMTLLADCQANEVCDGMLGACRGKVCDPGKLSCDGSRVVACNEWGSGYKEGGDDCAAAGAVCVSGACKKQVCQPNATFCKDSDVYYYDAQRTASTRSHDCPPNYHCQDYGGYASCAYEECEPGQVTCGNNHIVTCTEDHSWPNSGIDCGSEKYCDNAECKPRVCTPNAYACKDGDIYYCDSFGGPLYLAETCSGETTCHVANDIATCVPQPCAPGTAVCFRNKVGTCGADGQSLSKVTDDCTTAGNVCTIEPQCAKTVTDTLAIAEDAGTYSGGSLLGDVVDVSSDRKVTEMSINMVLAAPRELRWVIYEYVNNQFVARIDKITPNVSGSGFVSSGPISYSIKAGKRYVFGVAVNGGNAIAYYDTGPFSSATSFGRALGYVATSYSPTIEGWYDSVYLLQMKVTTEAPAAQ
jgi:hypothetical protein